ncbi:MAG: zinc ABC transporter substrate-binding protein [Desulfobulbaceae bacterium]|nr:zinc ABC transporter substrate-binding protein [Desulfobulbaceae bacterium]
MKLFKILVLITLFVAMSCNKDSSKPIYVVTSYPLKFIVSELVGTKAEILCLVPAGASPHTYAPKPSDVRASHGSIALIYVSENFDEWASDFPAKNKIKLMELLPQEMILYFEEVHEHHHDHEHDHNCGHGVDPHFWLDPITVKEIVKPLTEKLCELDPVNAESYRTNADLFIKKLDNIHLNTSEIVKELGGKAVFLQHPSFLYFLNRYNMVYAGSIEEIPGKEPGPKYIKTLVDRVKESGTKSIFSEPQLNNKIAETVSTGAGILLFELDPLGGSESIKSYSDLILKNAETFRKALR